jgi:hypothetical protein
LVAFFQSLHRALPGDNPLLKGLSYGLLVWFFRVVMNTAGQWIVFAIPGPTVAYSLIAGLVELLVLGALLGRLVQPTQSTNGLSKAESPSSA